MPSPTSRYSACSKLYTILFAWLLLTILSCKGEFSGGEQWWNDGKGTGAKGPKELADGKYKVSDDATSVQWSQTAAVTTTGIEPDPWKVKEDKLWSKLDEQVAHGKGWAWRDFYTIIHNARNNQETYKTNRSTMKWIMDRVATSSTLSVWFDTEIDKGESFDYEDGNWLMGTLKIWTSIHDWIQYVKISFSPQKVKWAYNVGDVWYGFAGDIHICCSRPVIKWDRDWQYTLWLNQWDEMTPKQIKQLVEQLLYGWYYFSK